MKGQMDEQLSDLEEEIVRNIQAAVATANTGRARFSWRDVTSAVFKNLTCLGKKQPSKYQTWARGGKVWGEWLFDLCWAEYESDDASWFKGFSGLGLVCECEWGSKEAVMIDFQKLTIARATLRLMVMIDHGDAFMTCLHDGSKVGSGRYLVVPVGKTGDALEVTTPKAWTNPSTDRD